jgi:hypothetical protein
MSVSAGAGTLLTLVAVTLSVSEANTGDNVALHQLSPLDHSLEEMVEPDWQG